MNVDKVNLKNGSNAYQIQRKSKNGNPKLYFTGNIPQYVIEKEINALNPPVLKGLNTLKSNIGEFQDICINACGTGILAPIFIKNNPLSKTDEDTRTYSAYRQPISAVLAIGTQGFVTIPIVNVINNMANEGALNLDCNTTPFKNKKYVTKMIKKLKPHLNKKQCEAEADKFLEKQNTNLLNTLKKENTIYYNIKGKTTPEKIPPEKLKEILNRTVDDMIKEENKQLKRCKDEKLNKRIARSEFYRNNHDVSLKLLNEMEEKINSTNNIKDINDYLASKYKALKRSKADQHLLDMVLETKARSYADKESMLEKIYKMQTHVEKYKNVKTKEEVIELVKESIKQRLNEHQETLNFLDKVKEAIKENKTVNDIEILFEKQKKANPEFRLADKVFSQEVIDKLATLTKKHIEGVKRISTLIGALAVLPVSCWLLNWIYPRFMDAVFPKLSSKKHNNESKELVDKATKNSEVK